MKYFSANKRGLSSVFGVLLFLILISAVASSLFVALYRYNDMIQEASITEETRAREKLAMTGLRLTSEGDITGVKIANLGSVAVQIRAFYENDEYVCDPSNSDLNTNNAYIKAQNSEIINIEPIPFNPDSYITAATSLGMKAIELESNLVNGTVPSSVPYENILRAIKIKLLAVLLSRN